MHTTASHPIATVILLLVFSLFEKLEEECCVSNSNAESEIKKIKLWRFFSL